MKHTLHNQASANHSTTPASTLPSAASTWTSSYTISPRISLATLTLAALLLTGCAQEKTSSASTPEVSQSTSAGGSASSPSDQATNSPTPIPSPSESISYSGGSKAPAGEYRPADEFGPAQNVPRPVEPEGMNIESEEGLFKFLGYWNETVNYGTQTGDFSYAEPLVSAEYTTEIDFYAWISEIYSRGGWVAGGSRSLVLGEDLLISQGNGKYTWAGNQNIQDAYIFLKGTITHHDNSDTIDEGIYFEIHYTENRWIVVSMMEVQIEQ
ncbi:MAG: DUF6318 family protein [Rothia sp. (in: high G+C Gram-positive bacteria)]|nr:DUF6318 family protein [Rothia sp. (in: high G+C Gram-positive bacteria)]